MAMSTDFLYTTLIFIATLAILISVHEYGHFWVARRCGIKVLRFSIGFGTPLYRWNDRHGTEFVIAALPLGGYVKMLDEREGEVDPAEVHLAFNRQTVYKRMATVVAGPLANFLLAIFAYWLVFMSGISGVAPLVGKVEPGSLAEMAGLEAGQEIIAVDGKPTPTWEALHLALLPRIGDTGPLEFSVRYAQSDMTYDSSVELQRWLTGSEAADLVGGLGLTLYQPPLTPRLKNVVPDSPAAAAGLKAGDVIVATDGIAFDDWFEWSDYIRQRPEQTLTLAYERNGETFLTEITPARKFDDEGNVFGQAGVELAPDPDWPQWPAGAERSYSYGMFDAFGAALDRTGEISLFTLQSIGKMLQGLISPKNLSGPITIAKVATASAKSGLESYLGFLALLSISLGVLNLLPIPVLDGGHILYCLLEILAGRPVPERLQMLGYQVGMFLVVGLMMFALYNDLTRL